VHLLEVVELGENNKNIKGKLQMKKLLFLTFITLSVANAWELKEVISSEGTETNLIQCDNGNVKAVYFSSESGKYEVTPIEKFDTLDEGAKYACGE